MSKRIQEMLAKSAQMRSTSEIRQEEVSPNSTPRTGAVRMAKLEMMKYESELPLVELHDVPGRKRQLTAEQFGELKANLSQNPLTTPVTVRRRNEGDYEIIAGHNRVQAYRELGREKILSVVLSMTDDEAERAAFYSNLLSPSLPDFEKYIGLRARMENGKLTQEQVARESGITQQSVSLLMSFGGLPTEAIAVLEAATDKGLLGASAAAKLAQLAKQGKQGRVVEAVNQLSAGKLSQVAAVAFVSASEKRPRELEAPIIFRAGKRVFCSLRQVEKDVRISFAEPVPEDLMAEMLSLIEKHAKARA